MEEAKLKNPFQSPNKLWRVEFNTKYKNIPLLELIFEDQAIATSCYEIESDDIEAKPEDIWKFITYYDTAPDMSLIAQRAQDKQIGDIQVYEEIEEDWVSIVQAEAKPVEAGLFYVANSNIIQNCPKGLIAISIDAGRAFGTGEHATTKGCLEAISDITNDISAILDVGTGTGVLAIAAKKKWPNALIRATDIDEIAIEIASENAILNKAEIQFSTDYDASSSIEKYDLIVSNILASPLISMKEDFYKMLRSKGKLIISGFIKKQLDEVLNSYISTGFQVNNIISIEEWQIACFTKN